MKMVSVVLLTNSKPELLREVLGSILSQDYPAIEPIVVLNGPHEEIESILLEFTSVKLIKNKSNIGFAAGMNLGVRESSGEYVYLTANDIILSQNYISELVRAAEADGGWGLTAGVCRNQSSLAKEVFAAGGTVQFRWFGMRRTTNRMILDPNKPYETDWIPGAGVFVRKELWDRLGGFREDFFFHSEDIEICLRVRKSGGYVRIVPSAVLYHHDHPNGISQNHTVEFHKLKNYLAVNILHGSLIAIPIVGVKYFLYTTPRIAWYLRSPKFAFKSWLGTVRLIPTWLVDRWKLRKKKYFIGLASQMNSKVGT